MPKSESRFSKGQRVYVEEAGDWILATFTGLHQHKSYGVCITDEGETYVVPLEWIKAV